MDFQTVKIRTTDKEKFVLECMKCLLMARYIGFEQWSSVNLAHQSTIRSHRSLFTKDFFEFCDERHLLLFLTFSTYNGIAGLCIGRTKKNMLRGTL